MASSSSTSAIDPQWDYDVFLSFRGKDTRDNFTSHLYEALCREQIKTFMDNKLERGEDITPALLKTIEDSMISVVIFSKNYASSPWCVDELVKILQCRETYGQVVLPVFYNVDPSDVGEQSGSVADALVDLQNNFKKKMDMVPMWKSVLETAANISGWDSRIIRPESELVKKIVQDILKRLKYASSKNSTGLVGIDSRIEQIKKILCIGLLNVRIIGIWGMPGIGKTTIAEAILNSISSEFHCCCFLRNVREESENCGGLVRLREYLYSVIGNWLQHKKVLVVLDDVNDAGQVDFLTEARNFGQGSRVIITSRDMQVLKKGVKIIDKDGELNYHEANDMIYEVEELNYHEAPQLFSRNAFGDFCPPKDFRDLSDRAVKYAQGNPLALKVLGCSLYGRAKDEWESELEKLEKMPPQKIYKALRISFDALDNDEKNIFLDVACFFKGQQIDFVKRILNGCGFSADIGIRVLADKCLIIMSENMITMHDLLQEMGHEIVQQESIKKLGKRTRLWRAEDVYQVLTKNLGTESVEGIFFDISKIREIEMSSRAFARMYNLRLLKIYNSSVGDNCKLQLRHGLISLSDELRYLQWDGYPVKSLPSNFHPDKLVELNLSYSRVKKLWEGVQNLGNLKAINLGNCEHLTAIPDLSCATNLERLNLESCKSLKMVSLSKQKLAKLTDVNLRYCRSLESLPDSIDSRSLQTFNLCGCSKVKRCPEIKGNVKYLNLNETAIKELPQSFGQLRRLIALNLKDCKQLENLPDNLRYLYLSETEIKELPSSIGRLSRLRHLDLMNCKRLKNLPSAISMLGSLEKLVLSGCSRITEFPEVSRNMEELYLDWTAIREIPSSIERCYKLVELHLQNCKRFEVLSGSICKLKFLQKLNLSGCSIFENFPEIMETMDSLRYLYLDGTAIRRFPYPIKNLCKLSSLVLGNCKTLVNLPVDWFPEFLSNLPKSNADLKYLRKLSLNGCSILTLPHNLNSLYSLEALDLSGNNFEWIPINISKLSELQYLGLSHCCWLRSLPELPPQLTKLDADNCASLKTISTSSSSVDGNIFDFSFANCFKLDETACNNIMAYALKKIQLYTKRLYNKMSSVPAGTSSFCFPGTTIRNFPHETRGMNIKIHLPPDWAKSEFLGFILCTVVEFKHYNDDCGFQVKCEYRFKNKNGDCCDLCCYFGGWYGLKDRQLANSNHLFLGYDPCMDVRNKDWFGKYSEVLIQFYTEDMNNNSLYSCNLLRCGVRLLYARDEI